MPEDTLSVFLSAGNGRPISGHLSAVPDAGPAVIASPSQLFETSILIALTQTSISRKRAMNGRNRITFDTWWFLL